MGHVIGNEVIRASIWIRPGGSALDEIQHAIRRVQEKCGGPGGWPHLSLLGGIERGRREAEDLLRKLAARVKPFTVTLGELDGYGDYFDYYRCFFARVELSAELHAAQRLAHEIFEMNPPENPYQPHVSLLYGKTDDATKRQLAAELGKRLRGLSFIATGVHLVNAAAGVPVKDWLSLKECPFNYRELAEAPGLAASHALPPSGARGAPGATR